ncbi:hypothetical protein BACCOPRO_02179 [Phocaeicola coprophilus DSM 18228 = JCM 13818]|uniref:Uncharacterized protein n=1 Tax=Phocaeicola coprophilus DSM 18228 = JCM 13818 TaxID=547042 RepID=S0F8E0_9BACT|nr:hypothetical protein BACCOPRO_02179 [Phocaeicola coprophilus DSM 18228 = JCM 13818]
MSVRKWTLSDSVAEDCPFSDTRGDKVLQIIRQLGFWHANCFRKGTVENGFEYV